MGLGTFGLGKVEGVNGFRFVQGLGRQISGPGLRPLPQASFTPALTAFPSGNYISNFNLPKTISPERVSLSIPHDLQTSSLDVIKKDDDRFGLVQTKQGYVSFGAPSKPIASFKELLGGFFARIFAGRPYGETPEVPSIITLSETPSINKSLEEFSFYLKFIQPGKTLTLVGTPEQIEHYKKVFELVLDDAYKPALEEKIVKREEIINIVGADFYNSNLRNLFYDNRSGKIVLFNPENKGKLELSLNDAGAKKKEAVLDLMKSSPQGSLRFVAFDAENRAMINGEGGASLLIERKSGTAYHLYEGVLENENGSKILNVEKTASVAISGKPGVLTVNHRDINLPDQKQNPLYFEIAGAGTGFTPGKNTTSSIFYVKGTPVAVDPTENIPENQIKGRNIEWIILTHYHGDHDAGTIGQIKYNAERGIKTHLITSKEIYDGFLAKHKDYFDWHQGKNGFDLRDYIIHEEVNVGEPRKFGKINGSKMGINHEIKGLEGAKLTVCSAPHTIPTIGFIIEVEGRKVGVTGDFNFDPEYVEQFKDVDVILCDGGANFRGDIHPEIGQLLDKLPKEIKEKIVFVHFGDKRLSDYLSEKGSQLQNWEEVLNQAGQTWNFYVPDGRGSHITLPIMEMGKHIISTAIEDSSFEYINAAINKYVESGGAAEVMTFAKDIPIIREDDYGKYLYVVLDGKVVVKKNGSGIIAEIDPGKVFGEMACLKQGNEGNGRTVNIIAAANGTRILRINWNNIQNWLGSQSIDLDRNRFNEILSEIAERRKKELDLLVQQKENV